MPDVTVSKADAYATLVANRKKHIEEYAQQLGAWQAAMLTYNSKMQEWSADGGQFMQPQMPKKPESYVKEYDALIFRLDKHVLENIVLNEHEFDKVFFNKFHWSRDFVGTSLLYNLRAPSASEEA